MPIKNMSQSVNPTTDKPANSANFEKSKKIAIIILLLSILTLLFLIVQFFFLPKKTQVSLNTNINTNNSKINTNKQTPISSDKQMEACVKDPNHSLTITKDSITCALPSGKSYVEMKDDALLEEFTKTEGGNSGSEVPQEYLDKINRKEAECKRLGLILDIGTENCIRYEEK